MFVDPKDRTCAIDPQLDLFEQLPDELNVEILSFLPILDQAGSWLIKRKWHELKEDSLYPAACFFGHEGRIQESSGFLKELYAEVRELCSEGLIPNELVDIDCEHTLLNCMDLTEIEIIHLFTKPNCYEQLTHEPPVQLRFRYPKFLHYIQTHWNNKEGDLSFDELVQGSHALSSCIKANSMEGIQLLLKCGVNPNELRTKSPAVFNTPPLFTAIRWGHEHIARFLIDQGADCSILKQDNQTALHFAAFYGTPAMVAYLLKRGLDKNAQSNEGLTPLHLAAIRGNPEIVRLLLEAGADCSLRGTFSDLGYEGMTPVHYAVYLGHKEAAELLLAKNPDPNSMSDDGMTLLQFACASSKMGLVLSLIEKGAKTDNLRDLLDLSRMNGYHDIHAYLTSIREHQSI